MIGRKYSFKIIEFTSISWYNFSYTIKIYRKKVRMKILIDADGCPVVDLTIRIAKANDTPCTILCDTSHHFEREGATTITVSKGADAVDFVLVNLVKPGDIVITQDFGLAAMCLAKKAIPLNQDGMIYDDNNIGGLLEQRAMSAKIRRVGGRLSGPAKRTESQNQTFANALSGLIASE